MDAKNYLHCIIAVLIGAIIMFALPATQGLSHDGVHVRYCYQVPDVLPLVNVLIHFWSEKCYIK